MILSNQETQTSRVMYLNSRDGHGRPADYHYQFRDAMHTRPGEVALVSLMSASLPYSFYNVRLGVNDALAIDGQTPVKLPPQNYTARTLADAVTQRLPEGASVLYDAASLTYTVSAPPDVGLTLDFGLPDAPVEEMGFERETLTLGPGEQARAPHRRCQGT